MDLLASAVMQSVLVYFTLPKTSCENTAEGLISRNQYWRSEMLICSVAPE
jgi:hypothetical protein